MPKEKGTRNYLTARERHNAAAQFKAMAIKLNRWIATDAKRLGVDHALKEAEKALRHASYTVQHGAEIMANHERRTNTLLES